MEAIVEKALKKIDFDAGPIIGIHIRRTDKLNREAKYYSVEEYFKWANLWYEIEERKRPLAPKLKRRVFVASDDPDVIKEVREKYPYYEVYANSENAINAQQNRYTENSLQGMIIDFK
jgi:glycoprotein 6-alpha-L-fucosyltransferase